MRENVCVRECVPKKVCVRDSVCVTVGGGRGCEKRNRSVCVCVCVCERERKRKSSYVIYMVTKNLFLHRF